MTVAELMPRVEKGAAWLDAVKHGWDARIDLATLSLSDCDRCVLGQMWGDFGDALDEVMPHASDDSRCEWAQQHGFYIGAWFHGADVSEFCSRPWGLLRECWVTVILERRFAATVPSAQAQHEPADAGVAPVRA